MIAHEALVDQPSAEPHAARSRPAMMAFATIGLVAASLQIVMGVEAEVVAIVLTAAALCYLAAAVFEQRWVAWATILGATMVVVVSETLGQPWWAGCAIAGLVLVAAGAARGAPADAVTAQTLALTVYGGLAAISVQLHPTAGLLVVGSALVAHAAWDVVHWRRNVVVPRSLAEFCVLLDVPLGAAAIVVAAERLSG